MAKVTRFLKLRDASTNEIFTIKMARIKLNPQSQTYTILERGDNLGNIIFNGHAEELTSNVWESHQIFIDGTPNYFSVIKQYDKINTYYSDRFQGNCYIKNKDNAKNSGEMWQSYYGSFMFGYEETYNLFFPLTYYDIRAKLSANNFFSYSNYDTPHTPPLNYYEYSVGNNIYYEDSCSSRTERNDFLSICASIDNLELFATGSDVNIFYNMLKNWTDDPDTGKPTDDPIYIEYGFPGKPSSPQGGDGDMKDTNEPVALLPSDVTNVAYPVRCYRLSRDNVASLHSYLWSNDFITNLPKLFSDPFSAIVGIQAIPYISPESTSNVIIGTLDTNIVANKVTLYYVTVDLGSIDVTEYWQNFLDYQPYTRLKLFLPYIGIVDLPTDLFMNNSVAVKYRIDIVSGACVAIVSNRDNIICTFTGNCSTKIPLSNNDHSNAIGNTLVGIAGLAGSVATGNAVGAVANTASIVAGLKERIQISGSLSTAHGILINDKPFLMIERPDTEIPENYAGLKGYTSNISMKLSETSGFTKIADIKLDGLSCTDAEKEELLNMMQNGIYL